MRKCGFNVNLVVFFGECLNTGWFGIIFERVALDFGAFFS